MPRLSVENPHPSKQLNVRLPGELAREVRVHCAYYDESINSKLTGAIEKALGDVIDANPHVRGMIGHMMLAMGRQLVESESGDFIIRDLPQETTS